ncbi:2'-5' RNA ligase family protein [Actinacidiphila sp. bgisy160]|uniref:2'-5' RNA ligase family protein n=1 Tax=Actinacidiphila sp. bgisy160 TaxID=3413796 RepID=UPI003D7652C5
MTGVEDDVGDVILPGAFTETLRKRPVKPVFSHEWKDPIGVCRGVEEWMPGDSRLPKYTPMGEPWPPAAGALVADVAFNMKTTRGRDVYEQVKQWHEEGGGAQWSIGYTVPKGGATKRAGVRLIRKLELFEVSPVLHGAHPLTMSLQVKGNPAGANGEMEYKATPGQPHGEPNVGEGVMIALYPDLDTAERIAHPDGTAPEELHVTLAYLGQAGDLGGHPDDLPDLVRDLAADTEPLQGTIGGIGFFPPNEDGTPCWVPVDVPGLTALQDRVASRLATSVFSEQLRTDHGFTPHLTLGYDLPADTPAVPPTPVHFDQLWVVVGQERTPIPLSLLEEDAQPPAAPTPAAAPAAAPVETKSARAAVAAARRQTKTARAAVAAARRPPSRPRTRYQTKTARAAVAAARPPLETKNMTGHMPGSFEEQRRALTDAIRTLFHPDSNDDSGPLDHWCCVEATYPTHVIATVGSPDYSSPATYSVPYRFEGTDPVLGAPQRVAVTVVAVPNDEDYDEDDAPATPQETADARYIEPAAAGLDDATSALEASEASPAALAALRPVMQRLMATLARKGMPMDAPQQSTVPLGDGTGPDDEDDQEDDDEMGWDDWDYGDDGDDGMNSGRPVPPPPPSSDMGSDYAGADDAAYDALDYGGRSDSDGDGDGSYDSDGDGDTVTLNPDDVHKQLAELDD